MPNSAVHMLRGQPFAAIIPGDGVAEQVITTGINQFLSLYNAALIGRLVLTWCVVLSLRLSSVCAVWCLYEDKLSSLRRLEATKRYGNQMHKLDGMLIVYANMMSKKM